MRRKAARLVAAKCSLAARVDHFHESPDGAVGDSMRAEIEQKLDKLQEPAPVKQIKPLAAPIDPARKKRGGRRLASSCHSVFYRAATDDVFYCLLCLCIYLCVDQSVRIFCWSLVAEDKFIYFCTEVTWLVSETLLNSFVLLLIVLSLTVVM